MTKTWRCYLTKVCGLSWVIRTGFLVRCCSNVSLTSSCSTMEWRQTSEQLIAPELAPQQSINSTTEEKVVFFVFSLRTVPLTLSSHYAVARWRFSLMTSSVLESWTWSVCAWTPQPVGGSLPWLDVSAGLQRSSFGLVDSVACEHFTSCSNSAMQYWAKHTCREGQSFLKRFPLKTADAMKLWNYETSVLWLWFNPILTLLLLYRAPVSCLQSPALSAVGLQTVNTAWRTETLVVLNNVQTFR